MRKIQAQFKILVAKKLSIYIYDYNYRDCIYTIPVVVIMSFNNRYIIFLSFKMSPGEVQPFLLQIIVESFLYVVQQRVAFVQPSQHLRLASRLQGKWVLCSVSHYVSPGPVHSDKLSSFYRHLLKNVFAAEDWFQVEPSPLTLVMTRAN